MRARILMAVVAGSLIWCCFAAAAGQPEEPEDNSVSVDDALAEPADPDDAADIRADNDPNDVGRQGLEASKHTPSVDSQPPSDDSERD